MGKILPLLVLLALLGGAGAWNYNRNLSTEEEVYRPFKSYAEADLGARMEAYRSEIDQREQAWKAAAGQRSSASGNGHIDDRAREFERIQATGSRVRALKRELAERQATLVELQAEASFRESERDALKLFIRRLTTI